MSKAESKAIELFRAHGALRASDALALGVHRRTLFRMRDAGQLEVIGRGVYALAGEVWRPDIIAASVRMPSAVVCLVSALDYYGIGTQIAHAVDLALPRGTKAPSLGPHDVRVWQWSGAALTEGVVTEMVDGVSVQFFSMAKTLVDCFRARRKIGINVAVEALKDALERRLCRPDEIEHFAGLCRMRNVMRPYMEALVA